MAAVPSFGKNQLVCQNQLVQLVVAMQGIGGAGGGAVGCGNVRNWGAGDGAVGCGNARNWGAGGGAVGCGNARILGGRRWCSWLWQCKELGAGGGAVDCGNARIWGQAVAQLVVAMEGIGGQVVVQFVVAMQGIGGGAGCGAVCCVNASN